MTKALLAVLVVAASAGPGPMERLSAALDAVPPVASWPLRDEFMKWGLAKHGPLPPEVVIVPVAEVYRGDRALLFIVAAKDGRPDFGRMSFRRSGAAWTVVEENVPQGWKHVEETLFQGPGQTRVVRRAGLPLEQLPAYLRYLRRDLREALKAAAAAQDGKRWAAVLDRGLAGVSVRGLEDAVQSLQGDYVEDIETVRLVRQDPTGDAVIAHFDVVKGGETARESYRLVRAGAGWAIDGRHPPADGR
jgi:hypothetical protein